MCLPVCGGANVTRDASACIRMCWCGWGCVCLLAGVLTWPEMCLLAYGRVCLSLTWLVDAYTAVYTQETHQYRPSGAKTAGLTYCEYKVVPKWVDMQRTQIYTKGVGSNSNGPVNTSVRSRMGK